MVLETQLTNILYLQTEQKTKEKGDDCEIKPKTEKW